MTDFLLGFLGGFIQATICLIVAIAAMRLVKRKTDAELPAIMTGYAVVLIFAILGLIVQIKAPVLESRMGRHGWTASYVLILLGWWMHLRSSARRTN